MERVQFFGILVVGGVSKRRFRGHNAWAFGSRKTLLQRCNSRRTEPIRTMGLCPGDECTKSPYGDWDIRCPRR